MRRLGMLAAALLAVSAVLVPLPAAAAPADDIHALLNQSRWSNGQTGLIRNAAMDQVAADWAAQLAASGTLSHNPDYASQIPGGWTGAAENVAQGYPTGSAMHDGWMGSSGHRANILGDYTDVGIAFLAAGGTTWGVEVFANYPGHVGPAAPAAPAPPPAPAPAPAPVDVPVAEPTPTSTATPTATPALGATTFSDDTGATEIIEFTRDENPGIAPGWWAGLIAGVVVVAGAAAWVIRRRRYFAER